MKKPDVDKMSIQQACTYAVKQIVKQGGRSTKGDSCMYSDSKGNHCAVGWLLDENDKNLMSSQDAVPVLISEFPDKIPKLIKNNLYILSALQEFHDTEYKSQREILLKKLNTLGISTRAKCYQQWVEMGS